MFTALPHIEQENLKSYVTDIKIQIWCFVYNFLILRQNKVEHNLYKQVNIWNITHVVYL